MPSQKAHAAPRGAISRPEWRNNDCAVPDGGGNMPGPTHHQVLIVGGGAAGITVAAILKRRAPGIDIAIVEPSAEHYYQPAFTLVGAGIYPLARTRRPEEGLI